MEEEAEEGAEEESEAVRAEPVTFEICANLRTIRYSNSIVSSLSTVLAQISQRELKLDHSASSSSPCFATLQTDRPWS